MKSLIHQQAFFTFFTEQIDKDVEILARLFGIFENHIDELLACTQARPMGDIEVSKTIAHKVRASCKTLGAHLLAEKLNEFEYRTHESQQEIEHDLEEITDLAIGTRFELTQVVNQTLQKYSEEFQKVANE